MLKMFDVRPHTFIEVSDGPVYNVNNLLTKYQGKISINKRMFKKGSRVRVVIQTNKMTK